MPDEPFVPDPFRPATWLPGPHAQTVAGRWLRRPGGVELRRERVRTADGDELLLDRVVPDGVAEPPEDAPVVLVLHGLEGSSASAYVLETARALAERGMAAYALNFRGCGGEPNLRARMYHAGETEDPATVLDLLARRHRGPLGAVGYSLGGNVLLKYLGERGTGTPVRAAAAVSVPFDLAAGSDALEESRMGRVYMGVFVRSLQAKLRGRRDVAGRCDVERALASRTFRGFDDAATAPLHGFAGADDYYGRSSSARFLHAVRVPTLLVHSADDPFLPPAAIPRAAAEENPCLTAVWTERGGHVGFVAGPPWRPRFWAEAQVARFLAGRLR